MQGNLQRWRGLDKQARRAQEMLEAFYEATGDLDCQRPDQVPRWARGEGHPDADMPDCAKATDVYSRLLRQFGYTQHQNDEL